MNYGKRLITILGLLGFVFSGLVGCAKGSSSASNISGNVSISGSTITSSDTVNGQILNVSVSGLNMPYNAFNSGYSGGQGTLNASVTVNGSVANLPISVVSAASYQGAYSNYVGPYIVYSTARCVDTTCANVALVIWVSTSQYSNSQLKQIGMIENLSTGTIRAAMEQVGYTSNTGMSPVLPSADQLIASMQAVMQ